jgi:signal transduction histidine kinase
VKESPRSTRPEEATQPQQAVALAWLIVGLSLPFVFFLTVPLSPIEIPLTPVVVYLLSVLGLDLFVGSSRAEDVSLQRITPAVVLGLLLTPGIPPALALTVDLVGMLSVAAMSRVTNRLLVQAGKALFPASLTAFYLFTREEMTSQTTFFACEVFIVVALLTRAKRPPFRADIFLIISYPAVALLLRDLTGLHLSYVLLTVPLLFLLTTVNTGAISGYFQLKRKLVDSQTEVQKTRRAQRQTEIEARRKGVLLLRKEQQLSMLNGLGREMDAAQATEDLGRYLLKESVRLTAADSAILLFCDVQSCEVVKITSNFPDTYWGVKEGDIVPSTVKPGVFAKEPWPGPMWRGKHSFIICQLGFEGWLVMGKEEKDAFPIFLADFFSAVGRHAGSAILALRRLTEVKAVALREAREKKNVAKEREKVAEQNRNLRILLEGFESLAEVSQVSHQEFFEPAALALKNMTGADEVLFKARPLEEYRLSSAGLEVEGEVWPSHLFCQGTGASGSLLCLSQRPHAFSESQLEWCTLLQDFLDKTMENSNLQQEMVVTSQWAAAGRLAANAAHELNTPLGAIHIAADHISMYLERGADDAEPARESMVSLMNSVHRCRRVTDRLLITSRPVDRGARSTTASSHKVLPILKDALASVRPYLRAAKVKVVEPEPTVDFTVMAVMQDLYWAIVNVTKNGIDALNETNPSVKTLSIDLVREGEYALLSITDSAAGVPDEVKDRLFEPFFTTKKLGMGNGLGLSLSRTNLRSWGGDMDFEDAPEGGATFIMKLPLAY